MKHNFTAIILAFVMALQASGFSAFAEQAEKVPVNPVLAETDDIPMDGTPNPNEKRNGEFAELEGMSETEKSMTEPGKLSDDGCVFNFSAAKYVMSETDASYEVFIERQGNADVAAEVVFKAIDILAVYGEDYTILDGSGNPLEKVNGTVIAPEQMKRFAAAQKFETPEKEKTEQSAGNSDIFEARNVMLGIDANADAKEQQTVKNEIQSAVETVNSELFGANGVSDVLHFEIGETQKSFIVIPKDNAVGSSDKTVLLALLGASEGSIAPNATASVVIMDDEAYEPPVFEMTESRVMLDMANPQAELTIRRISGEEYYSTVLVSTYSMTAQSGVDFAPLNNYQLVFAPGETEHSGL